MCKCKFVIFGGKRYILSTIMDNLRIRGEI